ncbi:uncharacterized protein LOC116247128 isoform X1 [Nymphaea colorata]|nr:uncharacterized protein LOC116247128 isoform X1 [Nymphaea colorata]
MEESVFPSSSSVLELPATSSPSLLSNSPLFLAWAAFAIGQSFKFFILWYKERRFDAKLLIGSGGMPSSHSATVTALAVSIGLQEGFDGSLFAVAAVLASVVMYDAFGVRLHAGRQAEVLNQIVFELPAEHPLSDTRPLRELLGHTPPQVFAGSMLGLAIALVGYAISKSVIVG